MIFSSKMRCFLILLSAALFPLLAQGTVKTGAPKKIILIRHAEKMIIPKEIRKTCLSHKDASELDEELSLSVMGEMRAQALAVLFAQDNFTKEYWTAFQKRVLPSIEKDLEAKCHKPMGDVMGFKKQFDTPDVLIAAYPTRGDSEHHSDHYIRTVQTIQPLAKKLGLEIIKKYHIRYTPIKGPTYAQDELEFYKPMSYDLLNNHPGKIILICWEHKRINFLAKSLGVSDEVVQELHSWPSDSYDQVWVINFEKDGKISAVDNFSQNIMQGDSAQAPKRYKS